MVPVLGASTGCDPCRDNTKLFGSLYLSVPVVFVPMRLYWVGRKTGRIKGIKFLNPDERSFDELFPDKRVNR